MNLYPPHLVKLIEVLKTFPGVGKRTAERYAFHLLEQQTPCLQEMGETIARARELVRFCTDCGCFSQNSRCPICENGNRDASCLCIVSTPKDAIAVEQTKEYSGLYHVLGGLLSPIDGKGPETLSFNILWKRLKTLGASELILALDSTVEGDATSLYLTRECKQNFPEVKISRLAFGLPMGSSFEYVDGGTLARALSGRSLMDG